MATIFPRDVLLLPSPRAARQLLGAVLVRRTVDGTTSGMVVETEAYCKTDPASHTFGGRTPRNQLMFGPADHAYVYCTYGKHWCFNVVTGQDGRGEAMLVRALEPLSSLSIMAHRRGITLPGAAGIWIKRAGDEPATRRALIFLSSGPAKLTQAMGLHGEMYGSPLLNRRSAVQLHASQMRSLPEPSSVPRTSASGKPRRSAGVSTLLKTHTCRARRAQSLLGAEHGHRVGPSGVSRRN